MIKTFENNSIKMSRCNLNCRKSCIHNFQCRLFLRNEQIYDIKHQMLKQF